MNERPLIRVPRWMFAVAGAVAVLSVALTGFMVYLSLGYSSRTSAYDSAQICASARAIAQCRFIGSAVIQEERNTSANVLVDLIYSDLPDKKYTAYFAQDSAWSLPRWQPGTSVRAELWNGNVTVLDGVKTLDNPDTLPNSGLPVAIFFAVATLILLTGTAYLVRLDRHAARG